LFFPDISAKCIEFFKEISFVQIFLFMDYNGRKIGKFGRKESGFLKLALIIGVMLVFLAAIFTAGYNDKPRNIDQ